MENHNKEQINKGQIFTALEKKEWTMPELIVIDKKMIEGGSPTSAPETGVFGAYS